MSDPAFPATPSTPREPASLLRWAAALVALGAAVNAYSYSLTAAIPLIQSDAWFFLDGFLGRFLEYGFSFSDLFRQANPGDTNLPLQKLFLFFHTRFFGMDFRLEGLLATAAAIVSVVYFATLAARRPLPSWRAREWLMLATLALVYLSINSTNIYTWPLAGSWFIPVLIASLYMGFVARGGRTPVALVLATFGLGLMLDEVAYPAYAALLVATLATSRGQGAGELKRVVLFGLAGLLLARLVYWGFNRDVVVQGAAAGRSLAPLLDAQAWKAAAIPLSESVVAAQNLPELFGESGAAVGVALWVALALTHVWFWWRVFDRDSATTAQDRRLTRFAAGLMLLFYGLVAGIVMQRVPTFGFDYLHQPRYVLFYQLNLVALVLMAYRQTARRQELAPAIRIGAPVAIALLVALQWQLSVLAWKHVKYLSVYTEGVAQSMGELQMDPASKMKCADIMTVCAFAPSKRAELLDRLLRYEMNIFSRDFQGFHRLKAYPPTPAAPTSPSAPAADAVEASAPVGAEGAQAAAADRAAQAPR